MSMNFPPAPQSMKPRVVIDGEMDDKGGFWVSFASADWFHRGCPQAEARGVRSRPDAEWQEWFVL